MSRPEPARSEAAENNNADESPEKVDSPPPKTSRRALLLAPLVAALTGPLVTGRGVARDAGPGTRQATKEFVQVGRASWYGKWHKGRKTASGVRFDPQQYTAAHRKLPLGTQVRVTNLETDKSVIVTINDRGPYVKNRVIDLSAAAAERLGMVRQGTAKVRIEIV
jgi:rare lipoprotein A